VTVFREADGRLEFVGDFDALYGAETDPWAQSAMSGQMADYYVQSRHNVVEALFAHRAGQRGMEIGCGHGYAMRFFRRFGPVLHWTGIDISGVAIGQAREKFPNDDFRVCDIRKAPPDGEFDVVVLNQVLWYVLAEIDASVANCLSVLHPGGLLVVSQAFLKTPQRYGAEIADGFEGALRLFLDRYPGIRLIGARYDDLATTVHADGLLVFRKVTHAD
jgi:SAM-dependent methyltransferase